MHSQLNVWKATIAVVIYVAFCMLILCFSPDDDAASLTPCTPSCIDPQRALGPDALPQT